MCAVIAIRKSNIAKLITMILENANATEYIMVAMLINGSMYLIVDRGNAIE